MGVARYRNAQQPRAGRAFKAGAFVMAVTGIRANAWRWTGFPPPPGVASGVPRVHRTLAPGPSPGGPLRCDGDGHGADVPGARGPQERCGAVERRPRRADVVDEQHAARRPADGPQPEALRVAAA